MIASHKIAVVIPAYKVKQQILQVISEMPDYVWKIYLVDDACPEQSGLFAEKNLSDPRVTIIYNQENLGVGGAVMAGYQRGITEGADVIVKVDGDGQMDPALIANIVHPILSGQADYVKGNRFFNLEKITQMPSIRLLGNAVLSLMAKLSTGYWDLFDPTNGYTAISTSVAKQLPFDKISSRYFFETDILFRLNILRAVVVDMPMDARYADEVSNLKISKVIGEFFFKHCRNFVKRVFYNYYLRDMSLASIELPLGIFLIVIGGIFGLSRWYDSAIIGAVTPAGTVMLAALPILMGLQFVLAFLNYDISSVPKLSKYIVSPKSNFR